MYSPTNLTCEVNNGEAVLTWDESITDGIDGYRVYQNGNLIGTTPMAYPLFQFPFSNESLADPLIEFSSLHVSEFTQSISYNTQYVFSVTAYKANEESDPVSINVLCKRYPKIDSVGLEPNPVDTNAMLVVSVNVTEVIETLIT